MSVEEAPRGHHVDGMPIGFHALELGTEILHGSKPQKANLKLTILLQNERGARGCNFDDATFVDVEYH